MVKGMNSIRMQSSVPPWPGSPDSPCVVVDCRESPEGQAPGEMPPVPVIAVANARENQPRWADIVVASEGDAHAFVTAIAAAPRAAAVTVQLLRMLPEMAPAEGLVAESMAYGLLQGGGEYARWLAERAPPPPAAAAGEVRLERHQEVLTVTMARPWAGNAIDRALRDGLAEAFQLADLDSTIARVRLRGEGRCFSLGAELTEFGTTRDPAEAHRIRRLTLPAIWAERCAARLEVHVQGACVGAGVELAAWAARITAGPRAWFQLPELAMGLLPGAGGCVSLTRRIGRQKAAALILSGRRINARQALAIGLVDALVDEDPADEGGAHIG